MTFYASQMHVQFDENGNPTTAEVIGLETDTSGAETELRMDYPLTAGDITGINSVVTNARAAFGNF